MSESGPKHGGGTPPPSSPGSRILPLIVLFLLAAGLVVAAGVGLLGWFLPDAADDTGTELERNGLGDRLTRDVGVPVRVSVVTIGQRVQRRSHRDPRGHAGAHTRADPRADGQAHPEADAQTDGQAHAQAHAGTDSHP